MSTGSLGLVVAALFALGAAGFTGKTLGARAEEHRAAISLREADAPSETVPRLSQAFETGTGRAVAPHVHACQAIAARHGARIYTATSPLGGGCLTLRLPLDGARTARAAKGLL
ncbi:hypothetical protein FHT32_006931 [Variovorax sp. SG517]|uniref:hypothetical protein n=1 Tax=Variovorax sp. SG517 TaxID=2587117 RepID=UPI00159E9DE3|nr:hypothetical protein [Variovorax sp. SG517]NVM93237.1 hypothetical protein [Variovorax sp. SG517]